MSRYYEALRRRNEAELRMLVKAIRMAEEAGVYIARDYYARQLTTKLAYYGYVIDKDYNIHPKGQYDRMDKAKAELADLERQLEAQVKAHGLGTTNGIKVLRTG
jgi:hypothetical protein